MTRIIRVRGTRSAAIELEDVEAAVAVSVVIDRLSRGIAKNALRDIAYVHVRMPLSGGEALW
jgi:hypothetical protein